EKFIDDIHKYPERYGLKDDEISGRNAIYIHGTWLIKEATEVEQKVDMLLWFHDQVGDSFRYFAVDSRLMPVSYQNTGIFYAPIVLSDNRVEDFIEIVAIYQGNQITLDQAAALPPSERAQLQYQLVWKRPFYESMFYRTFIGYSGFDQGPEFTDKGIPFVSGDLAQSTPLPAWNQSNWRVVHRTIHWNPEDAENITRSPRDWEAISYDDAVYFKENDMGTLDDAIRTISSGVIYIKWYAGAWINGTVTTESGVPIPGATITVHDDYRFLAGYMGPNFVGIPHGTTQTDDQGRYSILAPFGNTTVVASNGGTMDYLLLHEKNLLNQTNIFIPESAAMRQGEYNFTLDMTVPSSSQNGILFADADNDGFYNPDIDEALDNATMTLEGLEGLNVSYNITTYPDGFFQLEDALPGDYEVQVVHMGHTIAKAGLVTLFPGESKTEDIPIPYSIVSGEINRRDGEDVEGTVVTARDLETNTTVTTEANKAGLYSFDTLLAGDYSIELFVPGTRPINETVSMATGEEVVLNLTLLPVAFLEGQVKRAEEEGGGTRMTGPGEPLANTTLTFHRLWDGELVWTTVTNETGFFNTSLPTGTYTVYAYETDGETHLAAIKIIDVDADDWSYDLDLDMSPAYLVNGTIMRVVSDENSTLIDAGRVPVEIWNDNGRIHLLSNSSGIFGIYLPEGDYSLFTFKYLEERPRVNLSLVQISGDDVDMDEVVLVNGTRIEGSVFFDRNGNTAVDPGEGIGGAEMVLEAEGHKFNLTTPDNGTFSMVAAPLNYTVSIVEEAYEPGDGHINATGNVLPTKKNFKLKPHNVTYSGLVGYDWDDNGDLEGDGFPGIEVKFEAKNPANNPNAETVTVVTDEEGRYQVDLAPGRYQVKVQLDQDEDGDTIRYKYDKQLDVDPTVEEKTYNVWLERLVKFNGTLRLEDSNDSLTLNMDIEGTSRRIQVSGGEFDSHIPLGEHIVTATHYKVAEDDSLIRYELELRHVFENATTLDLVMRRVVEFSGVTYFDRNGNGEYDPADPNDPDSEDEAVFVSRFTLQGVQDHDVFVRSNGTFKEKVPPYGNYSLLIEYDIFDLELNHDVMWYHNSTVDITSDKEMEISLERRIQLRGTAYWEIEEDDNIVPEEFIEGVNVTCTPVDGGETFEAQTDGAGVYRVWLPIGLDANATYEVRAETPGFTPDEDPWEHRLNVTNTSRNLLMNPVDVTFNGTTFIDQNGNGRMNRYEVPVRVDHIELWDERNVSIHYTTETDENGSFSITVPPGTYNLYAWTEADGGYLVHMRPHTVRPVGGVQEAELPMTTGRRMSGLMYFHDYDGDNDTVAEVNLTFDQTDGRGILPVMLATGGSYFVVLPEGRYTVNGSFEQEEHDVVMTYEVIDEVRMVLGDNPDADLNFTRISEWELELTWDSDIPIWIDENGTHNFTIYAKNVGSENGTFDISAEPPPNWIWDSEVTNITLDLAETTSFWLQVNTSEEVLAGPQTVTVSATPRNATSTPSTVELTLNINQHYGFDLLVSDSDRGFYHPEFDDEGNLTRRGTYFFTVENLGNGDEVVEFSFGEVTGWEFEFPQHEAELKGYQRITSVPIEVTFPDNEEMRPQVLTITGTAQNAPDNRVQTLDLELSFPDLTAKSRDVGGDDEGEPLRWPKNEAPGFTILVMMAAIGLVALAADRRRRGW
ncbi:MAG: carboxypeptidase regulatory-like domain-containing protein, partial [Thermoplasmata archaeon]